jgi:hypothetical protein
MSDLVEMLVETLGEPSFETIANVLFVLVCDFVPLGLYEPLRNRPLGLLPDRSCEIRPHDGLTVAMCLDCERSRLSG